VRCSLLAEHAGLYDQGEDARFEQFEQLTSQLDCLADDIEVRLCRYQPDPSLQESDLPEALEPVARIVDPEQPVDGEYIFETLSKYETSSFAKGILKLSQLVIGL
jgi:phospholipase D1/2